MRQNIACLAALGSIIALYPCDAGSNIVPETIFTAVEEPSGEGEVAHRDLADRASFDNAMRYDDPAAEAVDHGPAEAVDHGSPGCQWKYQESI